MDLTDDLRDARLTVAAAAELASMHPSHFRRRLADGTFPPPKRTAKGRPFYDYELLSQIAQVIRTGIGENGEEVTFYRRRRRAKAGRRRRARTSAADPYMDDLVACLLQLGFTKQNLAPEKLNAALAAEFGANRPKLEEAIHAIRRQLRN